MLPMALSPTHPIAVYGFLAAAYFPSMTPPVHAGTESGLAEFLVSPGQVTQYRRDLLDDMADTAGGHLFAITRDRDGRIAHAPIRTWNSFLPDRLPTSMRAWLDRKEFPFLADEVELWLVGHSILAMGHYHAFGGPPSAGDRLAQSIKKTPEVVISNGLVPFVYLRGEILPYGDVVEVTPEVFRAMRALDSNLTMAVHLDLAIAENPSPVMKSFLGYLRDHRNIDISHTSAVAQEVLEHWHQFKRDYAPCFIHGFTISPYLQQPDHARVLQHLVALNGWATSHLAATPDSNGYSIAH